MNEIRLIIDEKTSFAKGFSFGETGPYESLKGRVSFAVNPKGLHQKIVTDISNAAKNKRGLVEFSSEFILLKPTNLKRGNSRLFYDYGNRGNIRALQFFNDAVGSNRPSTIDHAGNGFLFRRGYSVLFAAWQGDILPGNDRLLLDLPTAINKNGEPLKSQIRTEFIVDTNGVDTLPISGFISTRGHETTSLNSEESQLTKRKNPSDQRQVINADEWQFARVEEGPGLDGQGSEKAIIPSRLHIYKSGGFEPGWIYELVYNGKDPLILGCGYLVIRDLISFLKYEETDSDGNLNPLQSYVQKAYCWGRSQTGRAIRDSLYLGFNEDTKGRKVFDGVMPHVSGAGKMWFNHRFAIATSPAGQQYETHDNPADRFPFAYSPCHDPITKKTDSILKNPKTDPLVIHTQTSTEYWQRRGSLVHTDLSGNDLQVPDNVRIYFWSSSQHYADPRSDTPNQGVCQYQQNLVRTSMLFRALLDLLDDWASFGILPPESEIPKLSNNSLISYNEWYKQFPKIPGATLPIGPNQLSQFDYGEHPEKGLLSNVPPKLIKENAYPIFVPAVDLDGNEIAGIQPPMVAAPLATYTGWNLRTNGFGEGYMFWFNGSTIPFPETKKDRVVQNDPRLSILERYKNSKNYEKAIKNAAELLVEKKFILKEDLNRICKQARHWDKKRSQVKLPK